MKKNNVIFISILMSLYSLCSCDRTNKNITREYYNSGELLRETEKIDSVSSYCREYYKNGNLKKEGTRYKDGYYNGLYKEYFKDGVLKLRAKINHGSLVIGGPEWPDFTKRHSEIDIEGQPTKLKVGKTYRMRTYVEGLDLDMYLVKYSMYKHVEKNKNDPELFPYQITPKKAGELQIMLHFPEKDGRYYDQAKLTVFHIPVEE